MLPNPDSLHPTTLFFNNLFLLNDHTARAHQRIKSLNAKTDVIDKWHTLQPDKTHAPDKYVHTRTTHILTQPQTKQQPSINHTHQIIPTKFPKPQTSLHRHHTLDNKHAIPHIHTPQKIHKTNLLKTTTHRRTNLIEQITL